MAHKKLLDWCAENNGFGERLLKEWTGVDVDGNSVDINQVYKGSNKRMQWKCIDCNELWSVRIHDRTGYMTGCRHCREAERSERTRKATTRKGDNDLLTWCNNHGEYGKYLMREWTGYDSDGKYHAMDEVAKGSSKEFSWRCSICDNPWPAAPSRRTGKNKNGCPHCNTRSTSYPEQFLYHSLKCVFPDAVSRDKFHGVEYDIMLPSINTYIEYGSTHTHSGKEESDAAKAKLCAENGIRFISIFDDSKEEMEHYVRDNGICFTLDYHHRDESLRQIVFYLFSILEIDGAEKLDFEKISEFAFLRSHNIIAYEDSVEYIFPDLAKEWHPTANGVKVPSIFTLYSSESISWLCGNCGHGEDGKWVVTLSNRTSQKSGCPACGYNWYDGEIHPSSSPITIPGKTDFPSQYPELFKEWHRERNSHLDPFSLRGNSHERVFWECSQCHYGKNGEWSTHLTQRVGQQTGCPGCGYNCFDDTYHMTSGTSEAVPGISDVASKYPKLMEEWHPTLNKDLNPNRLKPISKTPAYWRCTKCGHGDDGKWQVRIGYRVQDKTGCPVCGYNWYTDTYQKNGSATVIPGINDIASSDHKNILSEWHPTLNTHISMASVNVSSHTKVYWECTQCHYGKNGDWNNTLNSRTNQKSGCPICGYNYFDQTFHKTTGRATIAVGINDIATTHPQHALEWHPTLNGYRKPTQFKAGSHEEVYWVCQNCGFGENGEWHKQINARLSQGIHCKKCRHKLKQK